MLRFAKQFSVLVLPHSLLDMASKKLNAFHVETNMTMTTCSFDEISVSNDKKENDNRVNEVSYLE